MVLKGFGGYGMAGVFLAVWVFVGGCVFPVCFGVGRDEADLAIGVAEADVAAGFVAVAEAEEAGAGVSGLVERLVAAGELLADAYAAFRAEDYEAAGLLAEECRVAVDGVVGEAEGLRDQAKVAYRDTLFWTLLGSSVGLGVFLVLSFIVWGFVRKRFVGRVLELKPEVGGSE